MSEISIIVPVYNAVAYLRKSLDSIVNQSYRDIEFIFVDDGSCDDSLAILKEYEAADKRVTVLHQENRGAGAARNYGMSVAGGKYLLFLDCDDIVETSMVNFHSKCKILGGVAEFFSEAFLCRFPPEDFPRPVVYPVHSLPV